LSHGGHRWFSAPSHPPPPCRIRSGAAISASPTNNKETEHNTERKGKKRVHVSFDKKKRVHVTMAPPLVLTLSGDSSSIAISGDPQPKLQGAEQGECGEKDRE
jgi:hypothetical protein